MRASHRRSALVGVLAALSLPLAALAVPGAVAQPADQSAGRSAAPTSARATTAGTSSSFNFHRTEPDGDQRRWEAYDVAPAKYKGLGEMLGATVRTNFTTKRVVVRVRTANVVARNKQHSTAVSLNAAGDFYVLAYQQPRYTEMYSDGEPVCRRKRYQASSTRVEAQFDAAKDVVTISFPVSCLPRGRQLRDIWVDSEGRYDDPRTASRSLVRTGDDAHFPVGGANLVVRR